MKKIGGLCLVFICWWWISVTSVDAQASDVWWNNQWRFRVPITVQNATVQRTDKPVSAQVNFGQMLNQLGITASFNSQSIRVIEVNPQGQIVNAQVPFQFNPVNPGAANGELVLLLAGVTEATQIRRFQVYFEVKQSLPAIYTISPRVTITDAVAHEGQSSFKIASSVGTYYYHKQGAGFASLEDVEGRDWISFHPGAGTGSAGEFRGIPNMGTCCHPGYADPTTLGSVSTLVHQGPLNARIRSVSSDQNWDLYWDIYPQYATLTVTKIGAPFWFLYEGTPGGGEKIDAARDYYVLNDGTRKTISDTWNADFTNPEWLYFGDSNINTVLYLIHHEDDQKVDSYRPMEGNMTVFGFGRQQTGQQKFISTVPARFTIGLTQGTGYAQFKNIINGAYLPITVTVGTAQQGGGGTPTPSTPQPRPVLVAWLSAVGDTTADGVVNMFDWLNLW